MIDTTELFQLRKILMDEYVLYKQGCISEKEYCIRAKPIDIAIGELEMTILQDSLVWQESFLQHVLKLKH